MASLPYPRRPPNSFHRTHSKFVCASPPTEFTEFTEISGGGYSPTDCTDFHRSRRVWHPCHTHAALRIPSTEPTLSLLAQVLPQNSRNSQKFLAEDILPRISRNSQKFLARIFSHRLHRIHRSFWRRRASHGFHRIHRFFFSASRFCVFREFCGKIVLWLRGYGRDAIPS